MNHARITAEALRYRLTMVRRPLVQHLEWDLDRMAGETVAAADPDVDGAIRRLATAWVRAGLEPGRLCTAWRGTAVDALFAARPDLIDALDDILRVATRRSQHTAA